MAKIVTFYSYKGGTGRSMALANVAWTLASNEHRVLVVDWDLEAPGLHRYFRPFLLDKELKAPETEGLIDFVRNYALKAATHPLDGPRPKQWHEPHAEIGNWATPLRWPDGSPIRLGQRGEIHFVPAGRQSSSYASDVNSFDWTAFYERLSGGAFFDTVREKMRSFDFILIDSRTGVSDTSGICTIQMPDALVVCYTYNIQSIEGSFAIAKTVRKHRPDMPIFPVAMRVEYHEEPLLKRMRQFARARFGEFLDETERETYLNAMEVPYYTKYAYSERLGAFEEDVSAKGSINPEINQLTTYLVGRKVSVVRPPEPHRGQVVAEFERSPLENVRAEPAGPAKIRWRSAAWAAVVTFLAIGMAVPLLRLPPLNAQRTNLILASLADAPPEVQIGALLENVGLVETPEAREFVKKLFDRGVPVASLSGAREVDNLTYHMDELGQRVIGCDNHVGEVDLWSADNGRLIARTSVASQNGKQPVVIDCLLMPKGDQALLVEDTGFEWIQTGQKPMQQAVGRSIPAPKSLTDGLPIGVAALSRDGLSVAVAGEQSLMKNFIRIGKLEVTKPPGLVAAYSLSGGRVSNSGSALKDTSIGFVFLSVDETGGLKVWQLSPAPRLETLPLSYPGTFTVGSRLLALATGQHISIIEIGKWHLSGPTTVSPAPVSTTLPVFSSNDDYFAYATESGFQVRKTTALDQVDWFAETSQPIPTRLRSLNISADGKTVQYGHLIYRKDRGVLDPDASWAELIKNLRAYTTICMPAPEREKVFLETKEEAKAKWETCETNRGRPQEPHPSPSGKNP